MAEIRTLRSQLEDVTSEYQLLMEFQQKKKEHDAAMKRMEEEYEKMKRQYVREKLF